MQMAIDVANFTPGEADQLRQAMGSKRSHERMAVMRDRLMEGMAANGITGAVADEIAHKLEAFADFGFPESHSVSFAYLVYASSWMKLHYPAEFTAALLNAQPMGFYSPHTIVRDARRHGVEVLGPDLNVSRTQCTLEPRTDDGAGHPVPTGMPTSRRWRCASGSATCGTWGTGCWSASRPSGPTGPFRGPGGLRPPHRRRHRRHRGPRHRRRLRLLRPVPARGPVGRRRPAGGPARQAARSRHRPGGAGPAGDDRPGGGGRRPVVDGPVARRPPHRVRPGRPSTERGVVPIAGLADVPPRTVVEVAGVVTHRQRPGTAQGVIFINLEDETGLLNVICSPGLWRRHRRVARTSSALLVRGVLERHQGVTNLVAHRLAPLPTGAAPRSRDFR